MFDFSTESGLVALFAASFIAATILPGGSEFVLIGVIHKHPEALWQAIAVSTSASVASMTGTRAVFWLQPATSAFRLSG